MLTHQDLLRQVIKAQPLRRLRRLLVLLLCGNRRLKLLQLLLLQRDGAQLLHQRRLLSRG